MKAFLLAATIFIGLSAANAEGAPLNEKETDEKASKIIETAKAYIQQKSSALPQDITLRVARRLYQCGATSGVLAKNPKSPQTEVNQFNTAAVVYFSAAISLYPGGVSYLKIDAPEMLNQLTSIRKSQKALFYLMRNCRDFLEMKSTEDAILELALD